MKIVVVGTSARQGLCSRLVQRGAFHINTSLLDAGPNLVSDINLVARIAEANNKWVVIELDHSSFPTCLELQPRVVVTVNLPGAASWTSRTWSLIQCTDQYEHALSTIDKILQAPKYRRK